MPNLFCSYKGAIFYASHQVLTRQNGWAVNQLTLMFYYLTIAKTNVVNNLYLSMLAISYQYMANAIFQLNSTLVESLSTLFRFTRPIFRLRVGCANYAY